MHTRLDGGGGEEKKKEKKKKKGGGDGSPAVVSEPECEKVEYTDQSAQIFLEG